MIINTSGNSHYVFFQTENYINSFCYCIYTKSSHEKFEEYSYSISEDLLQILDTLNLRKW